MDNDEREFICYMDGHGLHMRAPAEEIVRCRDCDTTEQADGRLVCCGWPECKHVTDPNGHCHKGVRRSE